MKKILLLSAITLGVMTSCSNDEMLSGTSDSSIDANSIVFSTGENASVATRSGVTVTSLSQFTVDAVTKDKKNYFSSVDFTFNSAKSVFESATPYYWPTDGSLSFFAISDPGTKSVSSLLHWKKREQCLWISMAALLSRLWKNAPEQLKK